MRLINSLFSRFPDTIGISPDSDALKTLSLLIRLSPDFARIPPWHFVQCVFRIGLTSRVKLISAFVFAHGKIIRTEHIAVETFILE